jgi:Tol biopolymer transport system component
MRACVVRGDGKKRRVLAESLTRKPYTWTQFANWSPDGGAAIIGSGWESPENARWEDEHETFRMTEGWLYDMILLDLRTGRMRNVTAVDRVSPYNSGLFYLPGRANKIGFQALVNGVSHPFIMDPDGHNKKDISEGPEGFAYGFSASPDGNRVAYHKDYQVYIADADGRHARRVVTGRPFNFAPQWSPDGQWLMFVSGEHYDCHPCVVRSDGAGLRKVADRGGYRGVVDVLDVYDFHGGSSDLPVWSRDGAWIYYAAKVGEGTELIRASLDGHVEQLTRFGAGALAYHPDLSPDGRWIVFGSNHTGIRQLYVMPAEGGEPRPITHVKPGSGAMWPRWQPRPASPALLTHPKRDSVR